MIDEEEEGELEVQDDDNDEQGSTLTFVTGSRLMASTMVVLTSQRPFSTSHKIFS